MQQWCAIFAAMAFLALPAMVSASEDTIIPPEANWNSTPPTPAHLMVSQQRVVSTAQEQASDSPRLATVQASKGLRSLSEDDAQYRRVNSITRE